MQQTEQILSVAVLGHRLSELFQRGGVDVTLAIGDLFRTGDLESLPALDGRNVLRRFEQRFMRRRARPILRATHRQVIRRPATINAPAALLAAILVRRIG